MQPGERTDELVTAQIAGLLNVAAILYSMASVVVPVLLADSLERRGFSRALTSTVLVILLIVNMIVIIGRAPWRS